MKPGDRLYDIWMPIAMIALVVIAIVSVASFVIENVADDYDHGCVTPAGYIDPCPSYQN